jgi:hypothetical protein
MSTVNIAPVKWAQRKDSLYVTISLSDVTDYAIDVTERKITFTGTSGGQAYKLDLELVRQLAAMLILAYSCNLIDVLHFLSWCFVVQGN